MKFINAMQNTQVNTNSGLETQNTGLNSITAGLTEASQLLTNYVVSPLQNLGLGGFLFDKTVHSTVYLKTQYTTNYVEKGYTITDHKIDEPKRITITGYVGERTYNPTRSNNLLNQLTQQLTVITALVPVLTIGMQQLKNTVLAVNKNDVQDSINNGVDFWNTLKALNPPRTKSGKAYNYFEALKSTATVMSITEPDGTYHTNMVITYLEKKLREDTLDIIDFIVEFQEFRTSDTLYGTFNPNNFAERNSDAQSPTTDQGKVQGTSTPKTVTSIARGLYTKLTG